MREKVILPSRPSQFLFLAYVHSLQLSRCSWYGGSADNNPPCHYSRYWHLHRYFSRPLIASCIDAHNVSLPFFSWRFSLSLTVTDILARVNLPCEKRRRYSHLLRKQFYQTLSTDDKWYREINNVERNLTILQEHENRKYFALSITSHLSKY